jgi:hypothetical protein
MLPSKAVRRPSHYLVIVRAGQAAIFEALKRDLAQEPHPATLIWDRRSTAPEGKPDRSRSERRAMPDSTWQTHGFLVVEADRSLLDLGDAFPNPAAEAQRQMDLYRAASGRGGSDPSFPGRYERSFGLEMFKARLRARVDDHWAQVAHGSAPPR